jgi:flagellar basal body rod protein FlgC
MSSLSIAASGSAAANLRLQLPANDVAGTADTRRQPPNANVPTTAPSAGTRGPVAPPNVDLASQAVQQTAAANAAAANAKAIQAGSSTIPSLLDIHI